MAIVKAWRQNFPLGLEIRIHQDCVTYQILKDNNKYLFILFVICQYNNFMPCTKMNDISKPLQKLCVWPWWSHLVCLLQPANSQFANFLGKSLMSRNHQSVFNKTTNHNLHIRHVENLVTYNLTKIFNLSGFTMDSMGPRTSSLELTARNGHTWRK